MRGILFSVVLIAGWLTVSGSVAVFGQNNSGTSAAQSSSRHYNAHLTPAQRADIERKAQGLYETIKAPDWSQRSDHDQYVILSRFLAYSGTLSSTPTAHVDEAEGLWKNLLNKNPQWKTRPPQDMNVKEYHEAIQKQQDEAKTIEEKAKNWRPWVTGDGAAVEYHHGYYSVAVHQYRIDFLKGGKKFKTITFGYPIAPAFGWNGSQPPDRKIFVIGRSELGYTRNTMEEEVIMSQLEQQGQDPSHWVQPNADYKEFYGVISIDGKILARIPFHQHIPDKAIKPVFAAPDGSFAEFLLGDMETPGPCPKCIDGEDDGEGPALEFYPKSAIVWTPKRGLRTVSLDEARNEAKKKYPKTWHIVP